LEEIIPKNSRPYYDKDAKMKVTVDASPVGLEVLIQHQKDGSRVIQHVSRTLSDVEMRYLQKEKVALSLVWACECFSISFDLEA
jgi:hypothetical protein